jgi:uncharacterized protein (DUF433 family)
MSAASVAEDRVAVTPETAARLVGATVRQINYWRDTDLVDPRLSRRLSPRNDVRLYDLAELVELGVVAALRRKGTSLQHIRAIVGHLRSGELVDRPLSELRFATVGADVYFQRRDGSWSGGWEPAQIVIAEVIPLDQIRRALVAGAKRPAARTSGEVEQTRGLRGGKPVVAGTRVPVAGVQRWIASGASDERILEAYPDLSLDDLEVVRARLAS